MTGPLLDADGAAELPGEVDAVKLLTARVVAGIHDVTPAAALRWTRAGALLALDWTAA